MKGFAKMTPEQRQAAGRKGAIIAHLKGTAHKFTSEQAREAGRKGGKASNANRKTTTERKEPTK